MSPVKAHIFIAAIATLSFFACSKEKEGKNPDDDGRRDLIVNIDVNSPSPVKSAWANGDIINVWFDGNISKDPDLTLSYSGNSWKASEANEATLSRLKPSGYLKFFWTGTNDLPSWNYSNGSFTPPSGKGFPSLLTPSGNSSNNTYTYDSGNGTLTASLKWECETNFRVIVGGLRVEDGYRLSCGSDAFTMTSVSVSESKVTTSTGSAFSHGVLDEEGVAFNLNLAADGEKTFHFTLRDPEENPYTYTTTRSISFPDKSDPLRNLITIKLEKDDFQAVDATIEGHTYVEMGDGLKWATTNVGAAKPEDFGDYFAWGETEPYYSTQSPLSWKDGKESGYDIGSYKFYDKSTSGYTKYNAEDGKTVLERIDDAASLWGGTWRTPTDEEWTALRNENDFLWTWDDTRKGYTVTSKVDGYIGNSIFLPAAGFRARLELRNVGFYGSYWSSTLGESDPGIAWNVLFLSGSYNRDAYGRCYGQSVRPVSD